jgi:hypothetical protein
MDGSVFTRLQVFLYLGIRYGKSEDIFGLLERAEEDWPIRQEDDVVFWKVLPEQEPLRNLSWKDCRKQTIFLLQVAEQCMANSECPEISPPPTTCTSWQNMVLMFQYGRLSGADPFQRFELSTILLLLSSSKLFPIGVLPSDLEKFLRRVQPFLKLIVSILSHNTTSRLMK